MVKKKPARKKKTKIKKYTYFISFTYVTNVTYVKELGNTVVDIPKKIIDIKFIRKIESDLANQFSWYKVTISSINKL